MKAFTLSRICLAALCATLAPSLRAADGPATRPAGANAEKLEYKAPSTPAGVRVHGAHRDGDIYHLPDMLILSPDHVGLTVQEHPSVFWYLSKPANTRLVMTLTSDTDADPLLETALDASKPGIHRVDLSKQPITLKPEVSYTVTLAWVPDPKNHSHDIVSSGMIKRIEPSEALLAKLTARANPVDRAIVYARQGIWYDALAVISDQIDAGNNAIHEQRAALLEQVQLTDAANFDRASGESNP